MVHTRDLRHEPWRYRLRAFVSKPANLLLVFFLIVLVLLSLMPMATMLSNMFTVHVGTEKKLLQFAQTGFPADFPFSDHTGITDRPTRFADDLTQAELVRGYTVRPTDIDFGRHMNNVAYVRVLLDCFSAAELASGRIASMEVHHAAPCLEGEELGVYCRREESGCRLAIKKADGKAAVLAAVKLR